MRKFSKMVTVEIYSDGACSKNPGPGGWACILKHKNHELKISGNEAHTTNNRMELLAIINAFKALKKTCKVVVYTDSKYVVDSINNGWAKRWQQNNWMKNNKEKALNPDLWQKLLSFVDKFQTTFIWVKGHNGHPENEICDKMAVAQYRKLIQNDKQKT